MGNPQGFGQQGASGTIDKSDAVLQDNGLVKAIEFENPIMILGTGSWGPVNVEYHAITPLLNRSQENLAMNLRPSTCPYPFASALSGFSIEAGTTVIQ